MSEPVRIQLSRRKGWRIPENTVKVDRSTRWGNTFTVQECGSIERAVNLFDHDLNKAACFHPSAYAAYIAPLVGKNLACWCKLDAPCHADVLMEHAREYALYNCSEAK